MINFGRLKIPYPKLMVSNIGIAKRMDCKMNDGASMDGMRKQLRALAGFLAAFEEPGFEFGQWRKSELDGTGGWFCRSLQRVRWRWRLCEEAIKGVRWSSSP